MRHKVTEQWVHSVDCELNTQMLFVERTKEWMPGLFTLYVPSYTASFHWFNQCRVCFYWFIPSNSTLFV